jgi:hypothetical protein
MTDAQLEARKERAENGALVVLKVGDGFRVYSVDTPSRIYLRPAGGRTLALQLPGFRIPQNRYHLALQTRPGSRPLADGGSN